MDNLPPVLLQYRIPRLGTQDYVAYTSLDPRRRSEAIRELSSLARQLTHADAEVKAIIENTYNMLQVIETIYGDDILNMFELDGDTEMFYILLPLQEPQRNIVENALNEARFRLLSSSIFGWQSSPFSTIIPQERVPGTIFELPQTPPPQPTTRPTAPRRPQVGMWRENMSRRQREREERESRRFHPYSFIPTTIPPAPTLDDIEDYYGPLPLDPKGKINSQILEERRRKLYDIKKKLAEKGKLPM